MRVSTYKRESGGGPMEGKWIKWEMEAKKTHKHKKAKKEKHKEKLRIDKELRFRLDNVQVTRGF